MTIQEAFERYRSDVIVFRNLSPKTEQNNLYAQRSLVRHITVPIEKLTMHDVRHWSLLQTCSPNTKREYLLQLRVVLRHLKHEGYGVLDAESIPLPKREEKAIVIITKEDVSDLIKACRFNRNPVNRLRNQLIISMLYASGIRVSELCSINRDSIKYRRFTIVGKGNKIRPCLIDLRTDKLLNEYLALRKDSNPALFISALGGRMDAGAVQEMFRHVCKRAGLHHVHPHTLRHTFATNLMRNGMHIYTLSRLLGHSSIQTTATYLHLGDKQLEEEYNKYHRV